MESPDTDTVSQLIIPVAAPACMTLSTYAILAEPKYVLRANSFHVFNVSEEL
jgi:hypothetical protein